MTRSIVIGDDLTVERELRHGERYEATVAPVSNRIGAQKLAYNVTTVAPGKRAFPRHSHHANEEMFFVLEGEGRLRFGDEEYPLRRGDFVACPVGGPEVAHQIVNTGPGELRYVALSTALDPEVVQYPDSGKAGVVAGRRPGQRFLDAPFVGLFDESKQLGYWDGE